MKKKLLALAVAGAFVAPAAMADTANVNIYGVFNVSFDNVNPGDTVPAGTANGQSTNKVSSNASRIGFKGTEDLGGGTSAIWQIEQGVNVDAGTWGSAARNTFVGLSGDSWGTLKLGNNDSAYKTATRGMDLFADTIADNRSLMGGANGNTSVAAAFDNRETDAINYTSPNMSGFAVELQISQSQEEGATASGNQRGNMYSMAGTYKAAPYSAALAYASHKPTQAAAATRQWTESAYKVGLGYAVDQFAVNFIYEKTRDDAGGVGVCAAVTASSDCGGHNAYYLGGKFNISGSDAVKLAYTKQGTMAMTGVAAALKDQTGSKQISLGYDHAMSKRTTVYALYTKIDNDNNQNNTLGSPGYSTGATAAGAGRDPRAFSVGLKHAF